MGQGSSGPPFDTQRAVEELVAAGMQPEQARVVVRMHARWSDRNLATSDDIDRLQAEFSEKFRHVHENLELKIEAVDHKIDARCAVLEAKIAQSATNIIKWVAGLQVGTAAVYLAALLAAIKF